MRDPTASSIDSAHSHISGKAFIESRTRLERATTSWKIKYNKNAWANSIFDDACVRRDNENAQNYDDMMIRARERSVSNWSGAADAVHGVAFALETTPPSLSHRSASELYIYIAVARPIIYNHTFTYVVCVVYDTHIAQLFLCLYDASKFNWCVCRIE